MTKVTILFGALLTVLGVVTYAGATQLGAAERSPTALIPAYVGAALILLGFFALTKPALRMHLMHAAVTIALLGFLASAGRFLALRRLPTTVGPASLFIMAILCGVYVVLCVRSFIAARRAREAAQGFPVEQRTQG